MRDVDLLLLDYIVEAPASFGQLKSSNADQAFNRLPLNLEAEALSKKLMQLVESELIFSSETICGASVYSDHSVFSLSKKGGEAWEDFFKPNWNLFILDELEFKGNGSVGLSYGAKEKNILSEFLAPISSAYELEIVQSENWEALYWKTFDVGFTSSFEVSEDFYDEKLCGKKPIWRE